MWLYRYGFTVQYGCIYVFFLPDEVPILVKRVTVSPWFHHTVRCRLCLPLRWSPILGKTSDDIATALPTVLQLRVFFQMTYRHGYTVHYGSPMFFVVVFSYEVPVLVKDVMVSPWFHCTIWKPLHLSFRWSPFWIRRLLLRHGFTVQ